LDEPTTGLDSTLSHEVMYVVKNIARAQRTILCTIHQPSPATFNFFDTVLLLSG
jgi:ABC-type multidrug transport system ATPase subunit